MATIGGVGKPMMMMVIKEGAIMPSEADVNAKIQELKNADEEKENKKTSGKQKLKDLGLDDDEINALMGV